MSDFIFAPPPQPFAPVRGGGRFAVRRIYCVGRNYAEHAREMGHEPSREPPFFFDKPADALVIAAQIAAAIEAAHNAGIIHRDLKPSNIIVHESHGAPVLKIIDFGVARSDADRAGATVYCPTWMPRPLDALIGGTYANTTAVSGESTRVETTVAMALAESFQPLTKSNSRARTMMAIHQVIRLRRLLVHQKLRHQPLRMMH